MEGFVNGTQRLEMDEWIEMCGTDNENQHSVNSISNAVARLEHQMFQFAQPIEYKVYRVHWAQ